MQILDSHAHMGSMFDFRPAMFPGTTTEHVLKILDESGIHQACVFPPLWRGPEFQDPTFAQANEWTFEQVSGHRHRLIPYARINPNYGAEAIAELERCKHKYDFLGLKLHPDTENFSPDNLSLLKPVMERCAEWKWPVFFHSGYYPSCQPASFLALADAFPTVPIILAHIGYAHFGDTILVAQECPNVYVETSANTTTSVIKQVIEEIPEDQFLYGSDLPFTDPVDVISKIKAVPGLKQATLEKILGGNMRRLLGMPTPAMQANVHEAGEKGER